MNIVKKIVDASVCVHNGLCVCVCVISDSVSQWNIAWGKNKLNEAENEIWRKKKKMIVCICWKDGKMRNC